MNFTRLPGYTVNADLHHPVEPIAAFVQEATARLVDLGYDCGYVQLTCRSWNGESVHWRFRPTIYRTDPQLTDIEAETVDECIERARDWLANLQPSKRQ